MLKNTRFTTKLIKEAISLYPILEIVYYMGYKSATRFIDDAQQRTFANELQKLKYDHLICYLFGNNFQAAKYHQIRNRRIYRMGTPSVYSSLLSN